MNKNTECIVSVLTSRGLKESRMAMFVPIMLVMVAGCDDDAFNSNAESTGPGEVLVENAGEACPQGFDACGVCGGDGSSCAACDLCDGVGQNERWEAVNPGGGGAFTDVAVGQSGIIVAASDLGGAFISRDEGASWSLVGAAQGLFDTHVHAAAHHRLDDRIILLAAEGGIYRSADAGASFTRSTGADAWIKHIEFSPRDPNFAYAVAYNSWRDFDGGRLLRSTDAGLSWSPVGPDPLLPGQRVNRLLASAGPSGADDHELYAITGCDFSEPCAHRQLHRSQDSGVSWAQVGAGLFEDVNDFAIHPLSGALIVSDASAGVYVDDLADGQWQGPVPGIVSHSDARLMLWPHPQNSAQIRVIDVESNYWHSETKAWMLDHVADTWQASGFADAEDLTGTAADWQLGWSKVPYILPPNPASGATNTLGFDPRPGRDALWWSQGQFVFKGEYSDSQGPNLTMTQKYTNEPTAGQFQTRGLDNTTPWVLAFSHTEPITLYQGLNDTGCWRSTDLGETWSNCNVDLGSWIGIDGEAYGGNVRGLLTDTSSPQVWMLISAQQHSEVHLFTSLDNGQTWQGLANFASNEVFGLSKDQSTGQLYVTIDGDVFVSGDGGVSWQLHFDCGGGCRTTAVESEYSDVYAGGEAGFFVRLGPSGAWQQLDPVMFPPGMHTGTIFKAHEWEGVSDITIKSGESGSVLISYFVSDAQDSRGGVFRCGARASYCYQEWDAPFMRDIAVDPRSPDRWVMTSSSQTDSPAYDPESRGVYYTTTDGYEILQANEGLAWPFARPVAIHPKNSMVFIGSSGGGHYRRDLLEGCYPHDSQ